MQVINDKTGYELEARFDNCKSFYGKARVIVANDSIKRLWSYTTHVASIKDGKPMVFATYSQITLRHIKEFLKQEGFKADSKAQIIKDYGEEAYKEEEAK